MRVDIMLAADVKVMEEIVGSDKLVGEWEDAGTNASSLDEYVSQQKDDVVQETNSLECT